MHKYFTNQQRILCKHAVAQRIDTLNAQLTLGFKDRAPLEYAEVLRLRDEYRKLHVKLTDSIK